MTPFTCVAGPVSFCHGEWVNFPCNSVGGLVMAQAASKTEPCVGHTHCFLHAPRDNRS